MKVILEINGHRMPEDTYEIIEFLVDGEIKIKAVFHDAPGYFKEVAECQKN